MEQLFIENDIEVFYVKAASFPNGVLAAFDKLYSLIDTKVGRNFFGISYPNLGEIVYFAATDESYKGEAKKLGCETFTIKKGHYNSVLISDFMKDISGVGKAFQQLLADPNLDPNGCCVEMYLGENDVRCMVRLNL